MKLVCLLIKHRIFLPLTTSTTNSATTTASPAFFISSGLRRIPASPGGLGLQTTIPSSSSSLTTIMVQTRSKTSSSSLADSADGGTKKPSKPTAKKRTSPKKTKSATPKKSSALSRQDNDDDDKKDGPWYRRMFTKGDEEYDKYMAEEWGFEKRGDVNLFEKISLEGAQSGLSWLTILRKRDAYRRTFHNFDIDKVAAMTSQDVDSILSQEDPDPTNIIVRHRGKIEATINNAKCIQKMRNEHSKNEDNEDITHGTFDTFLWGFVENKPILNYWNGKDLQDANSKSDESAAMSTALKKIGFKFVGPTTCYAMMQSVGMVIDHPHNSPEWMAAHQRLQLRSGGYQDRRP